MSRLQDAAALFAAWRALEEALLSGDPRRVTAGHLAAIRTTFADATDRLDSERRANARPSHDRRSIERSSRAVVDHALEALEAATGIDLSTLERELEARVREMTLKAAALLLSHRDIAADGGISERVAERWRQRAMGN